MPIFFQHYRQHPASAGSADMQLLPASCDGCKGVRWGQQGKQHRLSPTQTHWALSVCGCEETGHPWLCLSWVNEGHFPAARTKLVSPTGPTLQVRGQAGPFQLHDSRSSPSGNPQSTPSLQLSDTLVTPRSICSHYTTEKRWLQHCCGLSVVLESLQPCDEAHPSVGSVWSLHSVPSSEQGQRTPEITQEEIKFS